MAVRVPEAGTSDAQWTPLDGTSHLLYGKLDLARAERVFASFDANFILGMLHENYAHALQNETITPLDVVAAAAQHAERRGRNAVRERAQHVCGGLRAGGAVCYRRWAESAPTNRNGPLAPGSRRTATSPPPKHAS